MGSRCRSAAVAMGVAAVAAVTACGSTIGRTPQSSGDAVSAPPRRHAAPDSHDTSIGSNVQRTAGVEPPGTEQSRGLPVEGTAAPRSTLDEPRGISGELPRSAADYLRVTGVPLSRWSFLASKDASLVFPALSAPSAVVALGEATHGSREFVRIRLELTRELVDTFAFEILALEAAHGECRAIDRLLSASNQVADTERQIELALGEVRSPLQRTEALREVFRWIAERNATIGEEPRIRVIGIDLGFSTQQVSELRTLLRGLGSERARTLADKIADTQPSSLRGATPASLRSWVKLVRDAESVLDDNRDHPRMKRLDETWDLVRHVPRLIRQTVEFALARSARRATQVRDMAMAESLIAFAGDARRPRRVVAWLHDLHVRRYESPDGRKACGQLLHDTLGNRYVPIGTTFSRGSTLARDGHSPTHSIAEFVLGDAKPGSVEALLEAATSGTPTVFDVRHSAHREYTRATERALLRTYQRRAIGIVIDSERVARWVTVCPQAEYDLIVHVPQVTAATPLQQSDSDR